MTLLYNPLYAEKGTTVLFYFSSDATLFLLNPARELFSVVLLAQSFHLRRDGQGELG
jgi:hypothetical protein